MRLEDISVRSGDVYILLSFVVFLFDTSSLPNEITLPRNFLSVFGPCALVLKAYHRSDNHFEESIVSGTVLDEGTGEHWVEIPFNRGQ